MGHGLETPGTEGAPDWASLYRARGDEVVPYRPVFTGDVFEKITVYGPEVTKNKTVMILQHPCALRTNGVDLASRLIVAEVRKHKVIPIERWSGYLAKLPLAELFPNVGSSSKDQAAFFDELYLTKPEDLDLTKRIACLSQVGVNLLLQRWVNHNSRTVIPTHLYQEATSHVFEEADLLEDWCEVRAEAGVDLKTSSHEAIEWLRETLDDGSTRQERLKNTQNRSTVRREMKTKLRSLG